MRTKPEDVTSLLAVKSAQRYTELREIDCMRALARAHKNRNLADFEKVLKEYNDGALSFLLSSQVRALT